MQVQIMFCPGYPLRRQVPNRTCRALAEATPAGSTWVPTQAAMSLRPECRYLGPPGTPSSPISPEASFSRSQSQWPADKGRRTKLFLLSQTLRRPSAGQKRTSPTCTATPPSCSRPKARGSSPHSSLTVACSQAASPPLPGVPSILEASFQDVPAKKKKKKIKKL